MQELAAALQHARACADLPQVRQDMLAFMAWQQKPSWQHARLQEALGDVVGHIAGLLFCQGSQPLHAQLLAVLWPAHAQHEQQRAAAQAAIARQVLPLTHACMWLIMETNLTAVLDSCCKHSQHCTAPTTNDHSCCLQVDEQVRMYASSCADSSGAAGQGAQVLLAHTAAMCAAVASLAAAPGLRPCLR